MSTEPQATPRKLLNYTLQYELGHGGMATVWYAENSVGRPYAIKLLKPGLVLQEPSIADRFRNEAKIMVRLNHPAIRRVEDYYEDENVLAIIMEYLDGEDLQHYIRNSGPVPESQAIDWFKQVLDAFTYVHRQGYFHRDVKPSNLFLTTSGQIKVVDFGIAKIVGTDLSLTHTDMLMGSPLYMSPEQIQTPKKVDYHTDIYSLGVTLYTLLSGTKPYDEAQLSAFGVQSAIVHNPLPLLASVSDRMNAAIQKATRKDPADRFANCDDFSNALITSAPATDEATVLQTRPASVDESTVIQSRSSTPEESTVIQSRNNSTKPTSSQNDTPEDATALINKPRTNPFATEEGKATTIPTVKTDQEIPKKSNRAVLIAALIGAFVLAGGGYWYWTYQHQAESTKKTTESAKDQKVTTGSLVPSSTASTTGGISPAEARLVEKGIAFYKQENYDSAFALLNKLEQKLVLTSPEALTDLAVMYYYGDGTAPNLSHARQLFTKAETPKANYFLGMIEDGITDPSKGESRGLNARAVDLYRTSAAGGDAYGQATVGRLFLLDNSFLRAENPCTILEYLQQAKAAGVAGAANNYTVLKKRGQCQ